MKTKTEHIQRILTGLGYDPGPIDGLFGPRTLEAITSFQEEVNIYVDGIIGPITLFELDRAQISKPSFPYKVPATKYKEGYDLFALRKDAASAYSRVLHSVSEAGAIITSSGSMRALNATTNSNRSATSFHYLGLALDLYTYSGMINPTTDPYVIQRDGPYSFTVYARANNAPKRTLMGTTYSAPTYPVRVNDRFINLTAIFRREGFQPILARPSFFSGSNPLGAEWWHFQHEGNIILDISTFGGQLLRLYSEHDLKSTPHWDHRYHIMKRSHSHA